MIQKYKKAVDYITYDKAVDLKRLYFIASHIPLYKPIKGTKVLDIGCGNGNISMFLGSLGYQVLGIDVSEKAIEKAKQVNDLPNVRFSAISAEEFSQMETKYDVIICSEVLEHLTAPENILQVIHSILKNDGLLFVTVPNGKGPREVIITKPVQKLQQKNGVAWQYLSQIKKMMGYDGHTVQSDADDLGHVQFFSKEKLLRLAKNTGFTVQKFEHADFLGDVFPFSFFCKRSKLLQKMDCKLADKIPYQLTSGFQTIWIKSEELRH